LINEPSCKNLAKLTSDSTGLAKNKNKKV